MKGYKKTAALLAVLAALLLAASALGGEPQGIGAALESITLEGEEIKTLALLAGYANLQHVTLMNCPASDLSPLASCKRLTSVAILRQNGWQGGGGFDLTPLTQCPRLNSLTLEGACADDYTPLTKLRLKHLVLSGAPADQTAAVFSAIGKRLESAVIGDCTLTREACDAVLGCSNVSSLRFEDVNGIATDAAAWTKLRGLAGLQMIRCNLESLGFLSEYIATVIVRLDDISVGGVTCSVDFDKYFLKTNNVPPDAMLDFLGGSGCRWLYATVGMETGTVSKEVVAEFADIGSLLSLDVQTVAPDAWASEIWAGFPKLEQLKIRDSQIPSPDFLSRLRALERLVLINTQVTGSAAIGNLSSLKQCTLLSCNLDTWDFLSQLTALKLLCAADCNGPPSVTFTAGLKQLETLALENAPVTDLSGLSGPSLAYLYLYGCPIADYAPLQPLSSLFLLSCGEDAALPQLGCFIQRRRYVNNET